jgi:hypothetical protein
MMIVLKRHSTARMGILCVVHNSLVMRTDALDRSLKANSLAAIFLSATGYPVDTWQAPTASNVRFWVKHLETQDPTG